jgi:hypothetical protein
MSVYATLLTIKIPADICHSAIFTEAYCKENGSYWSLLQHKHTFLNNIYLIHLHSQQKVLKLIRLHVIMYVQWRFLENGQTTVTCGKLCCK